MKQAMKPVPFRFRIGSLSAQLTQLLTLPTVFIHVVLSISPVSKELASKYLPPRQQGWEPEREPEEPGCFSGTGTGTGTRMRNSSEPEPESMDLENQNPNRNPKAEFNGTGSEIHFSSQPCREHTSISDVKLIIISKAKTEPLGKN